MKKSLITLAILGSASVAYAQSSVVIYGSADISYVKTTGSSVTMSGGAERSFVVGTASDNTYLGVKGTEDLGGGLKATFQLEQRFNLANGKSSTYGDFEGAANVGLSGNFGQFRFGRVNELSTETYRQIDPFDQSGVAGMITTPFRGYDGGGRLSYTARYDSPTINGFNLGASYTVKNGPTPGYPGATTNAGYAISGTYANGPLYLVANYNNVTNSTNSYNWNLGAAYAFGPAKISLGYEDSKAKFVDESFKSWIVGLSYNVGNGVINASYNRMDLKQTGTPIDATFAKYALGYTHNLSKRTSLYANYAHLKATVTGFADDAVTETVNLVEVGINHKF